MDTKPNKLPVLTWDQTLERAHRILDIRGIPPYTSETFSSHVTPDEAAVLSDFVHYWLPFLTVPKNG